MVLDKVPRSAAVVGGEEGGTLGSGVVAGEGGTLGSEVGDLDGGTLGSEAGADLDGDLEGDKMSSAYWRGRLDGRGFKIEFVWR